jgi:hypothetical protein
VKYDQSKKDIRAACNIHRNSEEKRPAQKSIHRHEDNRGFPQKNDMTLNNSSSSNSSSSSSSSRSRSSGSSSSSNVRIV